MDIPSVNPSKRLSFEIIAFFGIVPKNELSGTIVEQVTQEIIRLDPFIPPILRYDPIHKTAVCHVGSLMPPLALHLN